jgi:hypothetical protein
MGFGREGTNCELIEIMQIPPRFEQRCLDVNASRVFCNKHPSAARHEMKICKALEFARLLNLKAPEFARLLPHLRRNSARAFV